MSSPPAPLLSRAHRLRQLVGGFTSLALLMAIFFAILWWRVNTPEDHLNLGGGTRAGVPENKND
jgi:hypothetical protein